MAAFTWSTSMEEVGWDEIEAPRLDGGGAGRTTCISSSKNEILAQLQRVVCLKLIRE